MAIVPNRSRYLSNDHPTAFLFLIGPLLTPSCLLASCSANPATGESNFSIVPPAQECDISADANPQVIEQFGVYDEFPALNASVARIALRLHSVSEIDNDPFTFTLLDSDMVSAFAILGGYVFVTRGLMALANNEAELTGMIGHESAPSRYVMVPNA